jgi:hypothetical protein
LGRTGAAGLVDQLDRMSADQGFLSLPDAVAVRQEFRALNLRFARNLVNLGAFEDVKLTTASV